MFTLTSDEQVFSSRPLFHHLCTTPLAGARLTTHLRTLLLLHGTYIPPQATLSGPATSVPAAQRASRIPVQILTDSLLETIKTRACFVGEPLPPQQQGEADQDVTMMDVAPSSSSVSDAGQFDTPPSSEVHFPTSSATGSVSGASSVTGGAGGRRAERDTDPMMAHSHATDLQIAVGTGAGRGVVIVPGWVRERAAEVLFTSGDVDERSVAETVLDSLRKVSEKRHPLAGY
jgi:actin-related protein 10